MRMAVLASLACCALLLCSAPAQAATRELKVAGAVIQLDLEDSAFAAAAPRSWHGSHAPPKSLRITTTSFQQQPYTCEWSPRTEAACAGGKTFGYAGGVIRVQVGRDVTEAELTNDWVLVHEMCHLALPYLGDEHTWLSEGLAVYNEGVARVQAGNRTESDVWSEEIHSMPRGMPQPGDAGLDRTHTWGRTYWGGAMFCLLADVEIHRRTQNRFGLQDAVRAILRASGGLSTDWPIERVLKTGDAAVGTAVLEDLYAKMKDSPMTPT